MKRIYCSKYICSDNDQAIRCVVCSGFIPARDLNSSVLKGIW